MNTLLLNIMLVSSLSLSTVESPQQVANQVQLSTQSTEGYENAKPINKPAPVYPKTLVDLRAEGEVLLSFVVKKDGSTDNIIVEQSTHHRFEAPAISAVKKWRYKPAVGADGPVEQVMTKTRIQFAFNGDSRRLGISEWFNRRFQKLKKAIVKDNLKLAQAELEAMSERGRRNTNEEYYYQSSQFQVAVMTGDLQQQMQSLNALLERPEMMSNSDYLRYTKEAFSVALAMQNLGVAKSLYEKLQTMDNADELVEKLQPFYEKTLDLLAATSPLTTTIKVNERGYSRNHLYRSEFMLDDVDGQLTSLQVRCPHKFVEYTYQAGTHWTVPDDWGQCSVYVFGSGGTCFSWKQAD